MTTKTQKTETKGKRPTHMLFVKSEDFNPAINIKIAAMWEHQNGEGLNFGLEELILRQEKDSKGNNSPSLYVNTKIYGQPCQVKIASFEPAEDDTFKMNFGDMVAFKTKAREEVVVQTTPKSQPTP
ncbi:hypothetical protein [Flagellimonas onchidii]|uniref:hypothetical protein n=1 Tax=Flagellimonas onchidii TaxID=2562684 RepID=UPI0010A69317|nr:hypothetical protein [Allomuricauda onchidii]